MSGHVFRRWIAIMNNFSHFELGPREFILILFINNAQYNRFPIDIYIYDYYYYYVIIIIHLWAAAA